MRRVATCVLALALWLLLTGTAAADPSPDAWAHLRACESSGDYTIVSAGGDYYGAYQFDLATWQSVGGTGLPNQATPGEQDYRALCLYRMRGWQPWTCARILRLQPDADAASQRVPSYADAAGMTATPPA
ncbi:MAG TPA: transglycosylase family protein, partial [Pseudonocardiaceae bacterium]